MMMMSGCGSGQAAVACTAIDAAAAAAANDDDDNVDDPECGGSDADADGSHGNKCCLCHC